MEKKPKKEAKKVQKDKAPAQRCTSQEINDKMEIYLSLKENVKTMSSRIKDIEKDVKQYMKDNHMEELSYNGVLVNFNNNIKFSLIA